MSNKGAKTSASRCSAGTLNCASWVGETVLATSCGGGCWPGEVGSSFGGPLEGVKALGVPAVAALVGSVGSDDDKSNGKEYTYIERCAEQW